MPTAAEPNPAVVPETSLANGDAAALMSRIREVWPDPKRSRDFARRRGVGTLLEYLSQFEGADWHQRWVAADLDSYARPVRHLHDNPDVGGDMTHALAMLCSLRVIRPSLPAFRSNYFVKYAEMFRVAADDEEFERFCQLTNTVARSPHYARMARLDVATALTTQQIRLADLTPEAMLFYARTCRDGSIGSYRHTNFVGHAAWSTLHAGGFFQPGVPASMAAVLRAPKLTPEEIVDSYRLGNREVSDMLAAYLRRRSYETDYTTLRALAIKLCRVFWRDIEAINPDQADLRLSEETYQAWRAGLATNPNGTARKMVAGPLTSVRALYLDIQGWAASEPEVWARWAAPCPISAMDMRAQSKERRRTKERMDDRTRRLQPHVPALVAAAREQLDSAERRLELCRAAAPGELFEVGGTRFRRLHTAADRRFEMMHGRPAVRARDEQTGEALNLAAAEDMAFWAWAAVEMLRHTGARAEELLELSQLSMRQYVRPSGEVIALLVVAPSKTDRERVIPMSAELFHVVAVIVRRLTHGKGGAVPLATRYDKENRTTSEPQPFLFQRRLGERDQGITPGSLRAMLYRLKARLAVTHPVFAEVDLSPHDFRRLLATELANSGLPVHIGAALLGHANLQTFHGYVTVFNEDVVRHYQTHLAKRRSTRPAQEYRPVREDEWDDFAGHFDKRKVELGQCGRPYATPCLHEHACIRCPVLRVDPIMLPRLEELEQDIIRRRQLASERGWLGETEGLDLTLRFLHDKREEMRRIVPQTTLHIRPRPIDRHAD